jgi:hypothetical protein
MTTCMRCTQPGHPAHSILTSFASGPAKTKRKHKSCPNCYQVGGLSSLLELVDLLKVLQLNIG